MTLLYNIIYEFILYLILLILLILLLLLLLFYTMNIKLLLKHTTGTYNKTSNKYD